jgi:hypothetical protein
VPTAAVGTDVGRRQVMLCRRPPAVGPSAGSRSAGPYRSGHRKPPWGRMNSRNSQSLGRRCRLGHRLTETALRWAGATRSSQCSNQCLFSDLKLSNGNRYVWKKRLKYKMQVVAGYIVQSSRPRLWLTAASYFRLIGNLYFWKIWMVKRNLNLETR